MGHRGGGYREDAPWKWECRAGEMAAVSCVVPAQVTHRGVVSRVSVRLLPGVKGRLSELVHTRVAINGKRYVPLIPEGPCHPASWLGDLGQVISPFCP